MALNKGTLVSRVRRMKDEIEGVSENESARQDEASSAKEEVNEDVSKRASSKQMRPHILEAPSQHSHLHLHQQQHQHRQHAATCLASKLVNQNEPSPRAVKQHQPHCIHHNPTCPKQLHQQQQHPLLKGRHRQEDSQSETTMPDSKGKAFKYLKQQDKSYLLVEYRPTSSSEAHSAGTRLIQHQHQHQHHQRDLRANERRRQAVYLHETNQSNNERTTIKFISQLYFLLHLSVILSLLMHHKNLVMSERKWPIGLQASSGRSDEMNPIVLVPCLICRPQSRLPFARKITRLTCATLSIMQTTTLNRRRAAAVIWRSQPSQEADSQ